MAGFAWDSEEVLGEVQQGPKQRRVIKRCMLKAQAYINVVKYVYVKSEWKAVNGWSEQIETFDSVLDVVRAKWPS